VFYKLMIMNYVYIITVLHSRAPLIGVFPVEICNTLIIWRGFLLEKYSSRWENRFIQLIHNKSFLCLLLCNDYLLSCNDATPTAEAERRDLSVNIHVSYSGISQVSSGTSNIQDFLKILQQ
jgi:hypothetical protein